MSDEKLGVMCVWNSSTRPPAPVLSVPLCEQLQWDSVSKEVVLMIATQEQFYEVNGRYNYTAEGWAIPYLADAEADVVAWREL